MTPNYIEQSRIRDPHDAFIEKDINYKLYLQHWKFFVFTIIFSLFIAGFLNNYLTKTYSLNSIISVNEESDPLLISDNSTNYSQNLRDVNNYIETIDITLKSRTHNEKVVSNLQFYVEYLKKWRFKSEEVYKKIPFRVFVKEDSFQLLDQLIKIETLKDLQFKLSTEFIPKTSYDLIQFPDNTETKVYTPFDHGFNRIFFFNQNDTDESNVKTPFLDLNIYATQSEIEPHQVFYIRLNSMNSSVEKYNRISINRPSKVSSFLILEMEGANKNRIADYLNESVQVLIRDKQKQKTLYATKIIRYIDELFEKEAKQLGSIRQEIGAYKKANNILNLSAQADELLVQTSNLSLELKEVNKNIEELDILEKYIRSNSIYEEPVPVPAFFKLDDKKISLMIEELINESTELEFLKDKVKPIHPDYQKLTKKIASTKDNLFENISNNRTFLNRNKQALVKELSLYDSRMQLLPEKEQKLVKYQKEYDFSQFYYNYLKQKKYEAKAAVEASISDIKIIDIATDTDQEPIFPRPKLIYLGGLIFGIVFPIFYIHVKDFFDQKIQTVDQIENNYNIPILGFVGKNLWKKKIVVFESPKSLIAESFRTLRSNINLLFKNNPTKKRAKTLLITSSVRNEGKTMISVNISTVFAMSGKKTILLSMDLRKPKTHQYFELKNDIGITNYLMGQKEISELIIKSKISNLDLMLCGTIPNNPSELILSDSCTDLFHFLEKKYDYIIVDTPPVGIVSDALELFKYSDAIFYIIRRNYSKMGMMDRIDQKYTNKKVSNISYVLNDFDIRSKYGYTYKYTYGYQENDQPKSLWSKLIRLFKNNP